jgi:N-methylhydantoinase A
MDAVVGVDVGGTFTDVVVLHAGGVTTAKVPTTPADQSRAVLAGVAQALAAAALEPDAVGHVGHGTTVATNALLERRGARTGFVATRGFADLLALGRQARPHLYRLCAARPAPLPAVAVEVDERAGPDGVERPLDDRSVTEAARALAEAGVEAVAVCLLHAYAHPGHERAVARRLRDELPDAFVAVSHEVAPEFREYERASTTVADAYLGPPVAGYLRRLRAASGDAGLPEPLVLQSSGGLCSLAEAAAHPARLLLSGPAGGVAATARLGLERAIGFDMGGTSCDVALVVGGRPPWTPERTVGGLPVRLPSVDVHTVGAGGGSIAWLDAGGALRVGPRSAGADPGPACYGRGGVEPTVTDANLVLGRLPADVALGGEVRLDRGAAERALGRVAGPFGSVEDAARGVVAVVDAEMVRAIRVVSVEAGHDPRECELVAFGGAGPLHACGVADELGIRRIRVPAESGVFSALGIAAADRRRDGVRSAGRVLGDLAAAELRGLVPHVPGGGEVEATADLRYRGQAFELTVALEPVATLAERFHERHEVRFGFAEPDAAIEVVNVRAAAVAPGPETPAPPPAEARSADGPAAVPLAGATLWIGDGWRGRRDSDGSWRVER